MKGKVNMSNVAAALASGGLYDAAMQAASRRIDFIADNYQIARAGGGALLGYALLHFGKSETMKAAGYGLLGVAGAGLGSKIAYELTQGETPSGSNDNPIQGLKMRLKASPGSGGRSAMIARAIRKRNEVAPAMRRPQILPIERLVGGQPVMMTNDNWLSEFSEAAY